MTEKRYRTEQIKGATLPFIVDNYSAKKHKTMTGYKAYDTTTLKKCDELTDLLNNYENKCDKKQEHIVVLENKIHRMRETIHKLEWLATHRNADLQRENWQLKQRCKELRNDLIDYSALIKMLEDAKALDIEDMIWNTMGYRTQTEFDDDFADYREDAKKRWKE